MTDGCLKLWEHSEHWDHFVWPWGVRRSRDIEARRLMDVETVAEPRSI
jgi:hypothetical protein